MSKSYGNAPPDLRRGKALRKNHGILLDHAGHRRSSACGPNLAIQLLFDHAVGGKDTKNRCARALGCWRLKALFEHC